MTPGDHACTLVAWYLWAPFEVSPPKLWAWSYNYQNAPSMIISKNILSINMVVIISTWEDQDYIACMAYSCESWQRSKKGQWCAWRQKAVPMQYKGKMYPFLYNWYGPFWQNICTRSGWALNAYWVLYIYIVNIYCSFTALNDFVVP